MVYVQSRLLLHYLKEDAKNSGGRNQKDEAELSDAGAATRNANVNENTKGTEVKEE